MTQDTEGGGSSERPKSSCKSGRVPSVKTKEVTHQPPPSLPPPRGGNDSTAIGESTKKKQCRKNKKPLH